jgi:hypothetical protein
MYKMKGWEKSIIFQELQMNHHIKWAQAIITSQHTHTHKKNKQNKDDNDRNIHHHNITKKLTINK